MDVVLLVIAFGAILFGAELFTNGIEWAGHRFDLAEGAIGSVFAAVGTALPETMIPLVAIVAGGHGRQSDEVGLGAILGAPFMLATLAMFVTGVSVLVQARRRPAGDRMPVDAAVLGRDVRTFAALYAFVLAVAFVPLDIWWARPAAAVVLLVGYGRYVKQHLDAERGASAGDGLGRLRLHRLDRHGHRRDPDLPRHRIIGVQVLVALGAIVGGAFIFVDVIQRLSIGLGIAPTLLAFAIAPLATELAEGANAVLWIRRGKDTLAVANITGAMVFQACIPTVVALLLAPQAWSIGPASVLAFASAAIAFASTAAIFVPMARRGELHGRGLLVGGVWYLLYLALVLAAVGGVLPIPHG